MKRGTTWLLGAAVLAIALAANLATRNGLWTAYTIVGAVGFATFYALEKRGAWRIPQGTLVALSVLGALHYLGGSLAGVHRAFGVNGLYYVLPWWDNLAHFLGGAIAWTLADAVLRERLAVPARRFATSASALAFAALAGVAVELYEFAGFVGFGTIDQGFYVNTMLDLYYDLLGATAAGVAAHAWPRWRSAFARSALADRAP